MISINDETNAFIKRLENQDPYNALWFAHQEATKVDRLLMKRALTLGNRKKQMEKYASDLRRLIALMRYAAVPQKGNDADLGDLLKKTVIAHQVSIESFNRNP